MLAMVERRLGDLMQTYAACSAAHRLPDLLRQHKWWPQLRACQCGQT
jgi:hypothetical protein